MENKSFYDILSTSQDAESRWAGRRKVLSDLRFDPTGRSCHNCLLLFHPHILIKILLNRRNYSNIFLSLAQLIEAFLVNTLGLSPSHSAFCTSITVCSTEAVRCFGCLQGAWAACLNITHNGRTAELSAYSTLLPCPATIQLTWLDANIPDLLDVGGDGLRVGEIVSVTKAKPKVGQWWQSAYVHGRGPLPPEVSCWWSWWDTPARNPPGPAPD